MTDGVEHLTYEGPIQQLTPGTACNPKPHRPHHSIKIIEAWTLLALEVGGAAGRVGGGLVEDGAGRSWTLARG
jgi:hypothetical protein